MSWSFHLTAAAGEVATRARAEIPNTQLADEKERAIRANALEIVASVADAHDPAENIQAEGFGGMFAQADKPARYSVKIAVQPHPAG